MPDPSGRSRLTPLARELRQAETAVEHVLWQHLRARGLGVKFRRQFPIEDYIVDFVCLKSHLVIEVDGDTHAGVSAEAADQMRSSRIQARGCASSASRDREVVENLASVLDAICDALSTPSPRPLPQHIRGPAARWERG